VDRWEIVISCQEYLNRFKDTLATVQLVNRVPSRQLVRTYHAGPAFNEWMSLGHSNHMILSCSSTRKPFFSFLDKFQIAQPGRLPLQASTGQALVTTSVVIYCLLASGYFSGLKRMVKDAAGQQVHGDGTGRSET